MIFLTRVNKYYSYPNSTTVGTIPVTWSPRQGLVYTYSAATMGAQDNVAEDQRYNGGGNSGPLVPIQGVCPPGWHIPSDAEWRQLQEDVIGVDISAYSTETSNANLAAGMKSPCRPPSSTQEVNGKSFDASQGGFSAMLVGYLLNGQVRSYGGGGYMWTSSTYDLNQVMYRIFLYNNQTTVTRTVINRNHMFCVRCKKNN